MWGQPIRALMLMGSLLGAAVVWPAVQAQPAALPVAETARALTDLNDATRAEVEAVRGVGVELAERLLAARASGRFLDWRDAQRRTKGLGKRALAGFSEAGFHIGGQAPVGLSGP